MKKLNNKGMTTIEVILCFVLISTIATSLFATISAFNEKKILEGYKLEIYTYKYMVTRKVLDDAVEYGIVSVDFVKDEPLEKEISILYGGGIEKKLKIDSNNYYIMYDDIKYELPDLGSDKDGNRDLKINRIDNATSDNVFSLYISFSHPDIYKNYGITLVAPINYFPTKSPKGTWNDILEDSGDCSGWGFEVDDYYK